MMEWIRQYLLSVTAAAIICSICIKIIGPKSILTSIIKLLCGIFIAVAVVHPVVDVQLSNFNDFRLELEDRADQIVKNGQQTAAQELDSVIISNLEAYILDKALALGADLNVEIILDNGMPKEVNLTGQISPYAKTQLSAWIENQLGIPTEEQKWMS